jgi:hypothetical protein
MRGGFVPSRYALPFGVKYHSHLFAMLRVHPEGFSLKGKHLSLCTLLIMDENI